MWNELKESPFIWKFLAFVVIPLSAVVACIMVALTGYELINPPTTHPQPVNQAVVAEVPSTTVSPAQETTTTLPTATETVPTATPPLPTATPTPTPPPTEASYELNWKIEEGQPIAYKTAMEQSECCTTVGYDRIFNSGRSGEGPTRQSSHLERNYRDTRG